MATSVFPHREKIGLYDPLYEHDACGVAFVAKLDGKPTHELVLDGLTALANLDHRGATGADAVGGGVVPMDPAERAGREAAGRLACLLAARADCVVQMFCGIPTVLKGELPK